MLRIMPAILDIKAIKLILPGLLLDWIAVWIHCHVFAQLIELRFNKVPATHRPAPITKAHPNAAVT